jgi:hypothetical protein
MMLTLNEPRNICGPIKPIEGGLRGLSRRDYFYLFARHEFITSHVILAVTALVVDRKRNRVICVRSRVIVETVRARRHAPTEQRKELTISRFQKTH